VFGRLPLLGDQQLTDLALAVFDLQMPVHLRPSAATATQRAVDGSSLPAPASCPVFWLSVPSRRPVTGIQHVREITARLQERVYEGYR